MDLRSGLGCATRGCSFSCARCLTEPENSSEASTSNSLTMAGSSGMISRMSRHASTIDPPQVRGRGRTWAHLHLPRFRSGERECISLKVPGQPITYAQAITLTDCVFYVSEAGRLRCLQEGVRNVHAWVVGTASVRPSDSLTEGRRAIYDPFKGSTFVDADTLEPVHTASRVVMIGKHVFYTP